MTARGLLVLPLLCGPLMAADYPLRVRVLGSRDASTAQTYTYTVPGKPAKTHCTTYDLINIDCTTTPATPDQTYEGVNRHDRTTAWVTIDGKGAFLDCKGRGCPVLMDGETYEGRWANKEHSRIELLLDINGKVKKRKFAVGL